MMLYCQMFRLRKSDWRDRRLNPVAGLRNSFVPTVRCKAESRQKTQQASADAAGVAATGFRPVR